MSIQEKRMPWIRLDSNKTGKEISDIGESETLRHFPLKKQKQKQNPRLLLNFPFLLV